MLSDPNKMANVNEDGSDSNPNFVGYSENTRNDLLPTLQRKTGGSGSIAALKELLVV